MKRILLAVLGALALLVAAPASAQLAPGFNPSSVPPNVLPSLSTNQAQVVTIRDPLPGGSSLTPVVGSVINNNDSVTLAIQGAYYANAHIVLVNGAAQATSLAVESSIDNVNWAGAGDCCTTSRMQAPMITRTDAASMNPTQTSASIGSGLNLNSYALSTAWDFPISGVTTYVRVRAQSTTGSAIAVTLSAGVPITPGVPVIATLFDILGSSGGNCDSGVIDFRGWSAATVSMAQVSGNISTLTGFQAMVVNDTNGSNADSYSIFSATPASIGTGLGAVSNGAAFFWGAKTASPSGVTMGGALPRRGRIFSGAGSGVQIRFRVELIRNQ